MHEALSGEWQIHLLVELQFLRNDFVESAGSFAAQDLVADSIRNGADVVRDRNLGSQIILLQLVRLLLLPAPSFFMDLFLLKRKIYLRNCFIIAEWREFAREKLPPFAGLPRTDAPRRLVWSLLHVLNDLGYERFILLFRVLLIEDAVALLLQADAPEAVLTPMACIAVEEIGVVVLRGVATKHPVVGANSETVVAELGVLPDIDAAEVAIHAVCETVERGAVQAILTVLQVVSFNDIFTIVEVIPGDIFTVKPMIVLHDFLPDEHLYSLLRKRNSADVSGVQCIDLFRVLFLGVRHVEDVILLILKTDAPEAITASHTVDEEHR